MSSRVYQAAHLPLLRAARRHGVECHAKKKAAEAPKSVVGKKASNKAVVKPFADAPTHLIVTDDFLPKEDITRLRGEFDDRYRDPLKVDGTRFVWDYWHVPDQYTLLRTPAADFFGDKLFEGLESRLLDFGQERLGCGNISPVWLSNYVHGCRQELHADLPHGPWAFVLSLTPAPRRFTGGETMILKPSVLDYWRDFDRGSVVEVGALLDKITPEFNRLTVFDARYPHGVKVVEGTHDPREGRLVLHGWFLDAAPFFSGSLSEEQATEPLNAALEPLYEKLAELPLASGMVTVALHIAPDGSLESLQWLSDTLIVSPEATDSPLEGRREILTAIGEGLAGLKLPASTDGGRSLVTLPLVFG